MIWVFAILVTAGLLLINYGRLAEQARHWKETIYV